MDAMGANNMIISLTDLSFSYSEGKRVIDRLNFDLHQGDRIGLVGPNGSGKTTLFHLIMGIQKPSSGRIELFGKPVEDEKDFRSVRKRVGLLFQDADDQLFSPTVLEDVAFGPLNLGKSPAEAKEIALSTLAMLGLTGFENRITYRLSGGEKRLVSLATVLAMEPEVLLLDEPTNGLDDETEEKIIEVLKDLRLTFVIISHNMELLLSTTDRIYTIAEGRIFTDEELVPHYHLHTHKSGKLPHEHK
jgi:cobalt/nickel transport system ATP-binding protein